MPGALRRNPSLHALLLGLVLLSLPGARALATTASVGADGNILLDGEPFFPIGIYHVSWIGNRMGRKAAPDLEQIADAGFNLAHPTIDIRDDMADLFDVAEARGVRLIGEVPYPENGPGDFIAKWRHRDAIIGWNIADDFNAPYNGPAYNHPPAQVAARSAEVKGLAPQHLTYASGGSYPGFRIAEFLGTMDVMGFQSYPLFAGNGPEEYALQENVDSWSWVRDQIAASGQLFIANPQAYRWRGPGARYPTPREARNMLYAPLLVGAKGILWYTFWEGADRLLPARAPELWADLSATNVELRSLTPFLLHGTRTELATGHPRVHAASWQLDGQVVVAVLNTDREAEVAVALDLPAGAAGPAHVVFPWRLEAGFGVAGGQLSGTIAPEEVHVYLVDLAVPGNAAPDPGFVVPGDLAFAEPATLDAASSSDPDGSVVGWAWDLGDGTLADGEQVTHAWAKPGTYFVRLTARDDDGATATTIVPVEVEITALCPAAPLPSCKLADRSTLTIRDPGVAKRRTLAWRWSRGETSLAELGDPTATTDYALCLYDATGLVVATGARADASEWKALGSSGFRLRDTAGSPGGLTAARLKPGPATKASLDVKGKGVHLPGLGLPLALPVTVQLLTSDGGACWQASFGASRATRSTAALFRGRQS